MAEVTVSQFAGVVGISVDRLVQQLSGAAQHQCPRIGQLRLAADDLQQLEPQLVLQLVYGVVDGRLAFVHGRRRLSETAVLDHGLQHAPLFQCTFVHGSPCVF